MLTKPLCLLSDYPKIAFFFSVWFLIMIIYGGYCLSCRLVCGCVRKRGFVISCLVVVWQQEKCCEAGYRALGPVCEVNMKLADLGSLATWKVDLGSKVFLTPDQEIATEFSHGTYVYFLKVKWRSEARHCPGPTTKVPPFPPFKFVYNNFK